MQQHIISLLAIAFLVSACCDDDGPKTCKESIKTPVSNKTCTTTPSPEPEPSEIFTVVEDPPKYVGGDSTLTPNENLLAFIKENLVYPSEALVENLEGTVYVVFAIEVDGCVSSIKIVKGLGCGCSDEALRLAELMPNWKPGKQRGKPVRTRYSLPIKFEL